MLSYLFSYLMPLDGSTELHSATWWVLRLQVLSTANDVTESGTQLGLCVLRVGGFYDCPHSATGFLFEMSQYIV